LIVRKHSEPVLELDLKNYYSGLDCKENFRVFLFLTAKTKIHAKLSKRPYRPTNDK